METLHFGHCFDVFSIRKSLSVSMGTGRAGADAGAGKYPGTGISGAANGGAEALALLRASMGHTPPMASSLQQVQNFLLH
jgi:hypothetical protein